MCEQVRGYNVGELAACRSFVEGAVELRLPLPVRTPSPLCGNSLSYACLSALFRLLP